MQDLDQLTQTIEASFNRIHDEQMQGLPLLNPMLRVETVGFQHYDGRTVGIVITPWLMNLILFPAEGEDWSQMELGHKQPHRFPSNRYKFMVNEIDGLGRCQTHSLFSPMHEFVNHDHAVAAAQSFMETLMVEVEKPDEDPYDEELLGRILRGEETPEVEMDGFALAEQKAAAGNMPDMETAEPGITRRDLLRGGWRDG
ncbi:MAG: [NiFe]-hydrogenase assembly chaperone HybE [Candidatus Thiodiazotropha sp. (ex Monitilora ramsayi)]|nr:[NiFe]-hydrogenase assembly chaperone HybE [Candidatus Thiodiazotropha sp. (ex Monitilora ramsayi)]